MINLFLMVFQIAFFLNWFKCPVLACKPASVVDNICSLLEVLTQEQRFQHLTPISHQRIV